jgi:hypothetical protein
MLLDRTGAFGTDEGALPFAIDIAESDTFRLGYADLELIVNDTEEVALCLISDRKSTFCTSYCLHRFLMQRQTETMPFETSAPTFGFNSYCEFCGTKRLNLPNSASHESLFD